jgi:branched-chain amino acid transport system ATP-binding protein
MECPVTSRGIRRSLKPISEGRSEPVLVVEDIVTHYGQIRALNGVSIRVSKGEIVTLIGANGAGKTTLLKSIVNVAPPRSGEIRFLDEQMHGLSTEAIVKKGVVLVQEGRGLLRRMTVLENVLMGAYTVKNKDEIRRGMELVFNLFPVLQKRQRQMSGTLSGGEQQMLAIARALMAQPTLLMMDEPSLGLAPLMVNEIFKVIRSLHQMGCTILLVEQNARKALQVSNRAYVLELGRIALEGPSAELLGSDEVRKVYLGGE